MDELLSLVERIAKEYYDGDYTVIHRNGGYGAMWGLPGNDDYMAAIKKIPAKKTLKEALMDMVARNFSDEPHKPYAHASAV